MQKTVKLSLIIPCYNEEKTLRLIIERVLKIRRDWLLPELVIVDDCSKDGSRGVAEQLRAEHPEIILVHHEINQGKGAALRTGFLKASGDFIGVQDADMEYDPEDYLTLLEPLLDGRADVVYGSRYLRPETRRVLYFWHTWMNKTLTACSNMFTNLDLTDMETCYKLFRRDVIQKIAPRLKENRFGFEPEVTALVSEENCRVYECAIHYNPRSYEEGKKIGWKDGLRALYCILHYGAWRAPMPVQLLLYLFIGGAAVLVNLICFAVCMNCSVKLLPAVIGSYLLSAAVHYIFCVPVLLRRKACRCTAGELAAYTAGLAVMGILDYGVTAGLIGMLSMRPIWAKAVSSLVGFFGNYLLCGRIVFFLRGRKP